MRDAGFNTVRIYTPPPRWLLDIAQMFELRVMVGLAWEQHVAFLDDPARFQQILSDVRATVKVLAGHSAVLCYAVGNEIPAPVVRWHGKTRIERSIRKLCAAVKSADEAALITYVNYPTTEFLELPFLDFVSVNVYLESRERFASYLSRLQNLAGERPLVLAELGLDSRRNGESAQAHSLAWQILKDFRAAVLGSSCLPGPTNGSVAVNRSLTGTSELPRGNGELRMPCVRFRPSSRACLFNRICIGRRFRWWYAVTTARGQ